MAAFSIVDITKFYSDQSGGVRTYLDAKRHYLASRNVRHTVIVPGPKTTLSRVAQTDVWTVRGPVIPFAPSYRLIASPHAVSTILRIAQPDVVEVGSPFLVPRLVWRALRERGTPTIGFYHSDLIRTYAEPYVQHRLAAPLRVASRNVARAYIRRTYSRFDAVVAPSSAIANELQQLGLQNVHCIPMGVDLQIFSPRPEMRADLRREFQLPADRKIAIYAGRFAREKRIDIVLRAHAHLTGGTRPLLVFVGSGSEEATIRQAALQQGDIVTLPHERDPLRIAALLNAADFYVACGPGETFGLAIAEALACGLPIVAVNSGAAAEHADQSRAWIYQHGDVRSCAHALAAATQECDSERSANARVYAEHHYSWANTFERLLQLYEEVQHCAAG